MNQLLLSTWLVVAARYLLVATVAFVCGQIKGQLDERYRWMHPTKHKKDV